MKRKLYSELLDWKAKGAKKPLILIGACQVGKTYIIEEFLSREFPKHLTFNLFDRSDICAIFSEEIQTGEKIRRLELLHGEKIDFENTAIFFDEVQHSEDIIASLKYFADSKINYKIICAGSLLGVKINRFSKSFPVGKAEMLYMYPMDFEEYLWANGEHELSAEIRRCFEKNKNMSEPLHEKCLYRYRLYLCAGGMPEAAADLISKDNDVLRFNGRILSDIRMAYLADMTKYVTSKAESAKIEAVSAVNMPLKGYVRDGFFKIFLNDTGLLCNLLFIRLSEIMLDTDFYYKGIITENYAASQLAAAGIPLFYWQGENTQDIDFLIDTEQGIVPVEVKSGKNKASASLEYFRENHNCAYALKIRKGNFGFTNKIRNIPLYAVFCLK